MAAPNGTKHSPHQQVIDLVNAISGQKGTLTLPRIFIKVAGDPLAGLFLSEVVWNTDKSARDDGFFWKSAREWKEELELSYAQVKRITSQLEAAGLIETRLMKAQGAPTMHYRPIMDNVITAILDFLENQKDRNSIKHDIENRQSDKSIDSQESEESITTHDTTLTTTHEQATPVPAGDAPAPLITFQDWLTVLRERKNRQAVIVQMHETLYPNHDPPSFGYAAKVARAVGGWSMLAKDLWELSARPPVGDVLAYIQRMHQNKRKPEATPDDYAADAAQLNAAAEARLAAEPEPTTPEAERWAAVKEELHSRLDGPTWETYIEPTEALEQTNGTLRVRAPSAEIAEWNNTRLSRPIAAAMAAVAGGVGVEFVEEDK